MKLFTKPAPRFFELLPRSPDLMFLATPFCTAPRQHAANARRLQRCVTCGYPGSSPASCG